MHLGAARSGEFDDNGLHPPPRFQFLVQLLQLLQPPLRVLVRDSLDQRQSDVGVSRSSAATSSPAPAARAARAARQSPVSGGSSSSSSGVSRPSLSAPLIAQWFRLWPVPLAVLAAASSPGSLATFAAMLVIGQCHIHALAPAQHPSQRKKSSRPIDDGGESQAMSSQDTRAAIVLSQSVIRLLSSVS
jgi:hypothetical protein